MGDKPPKPPKKPTPPKLPDEAPRELKNFVACKVTTVAIDPAKLDWLPRPPLAGPPNATVEVKGADKVEVSVGFGDAEKIKLPISVEGGELKVDSSGVPDFLGMKAGVDNWVKKLNDVVKGNGKEFDRLEVNDGKVVLTKRGAAGANAGGGALKSTGAKVAVGVSAAVLIGFGVVALTKNDDSGSGSITPVAAGTTGPPPAAPVDSAGQPPPDSADVVVVDSAPPEPPLAVTCQGFAGTPIKVAGDPVWTPFLEEPCTDMSGGFPPVVLPTGSLLEVNIDPMVYITHDGSEPDALTGVTGPSKATFRIEVFGAPPGGLIVQSDCGGQLVTGLATLVPDGPTTVSHPLFQYGPCTVKQFAVAFDPPYDESVLDLMNRVEFGIFDVGPVANPVVSTPIPIVFGGVPPNASWTVLSTLANQWLPPECGMVLVPQTASVSNPRCPVPDFFWLYGSWSSLGDQPVRAFGAAKVEPTEGAPLDWSDVLFSQTIFPCGPGQIGMTICGDGPAEISLPTFTAVSVVLAAPFPTTPDGSTADEPIALDFSSSGGPTYRLISHDGEWTLASDTETSARAIIRDDSVTFVVPSDELPAAEVTYVVSFTGTDGSVVASGVTPVSGHIPGRPAAPETPTSTSVVASTTVAVETSTSVVSVPAETPESFFAALSASIASGDPDFAVERLDPAVIATYSPEECRVELESRAAPGYTITVVSVGATGPWTYAPPDRPPTEIPEALSVMVTIPGGASPVEAHLTLVDGTYRWFTVCT